MIELISTLTKGVFDKYFLSSKEESKPSKLSNLRAMDIERSEFTTIAFIESPCPKATAFSMVICNLLRGVNYEQMSAKDLHVYGHLVGIALHNIPIYLSENALPLDIYEQINLLDSTGGLDRWGICCIELADAFNQQLPSIKNRDRNEPTHH